MKKSREEMGEIIFASHRQLREAIAENHEYGYAIDDIHFSFYYTPHKIIVSQIIQEIESHISKKKPTKVESIQAGYKFEELMLAVFSRHRRMVFA